MKWYYEWKLKKVRAEIAALEEQTRVHLQDDYTGHSRLRVLYRLNATLQQRLSKPAATAPAVPVPVPERLEVEEAH